MLLALPEFIFLRSVSALELRWRAYGRNDNLPRHWRAAPVVLWDGRLRGAPCIAFADFSLASSWCRCLHPLGSGSVVVCGRTLLGDFLRRDGPLSLPPFAVAEGPFGAWRGRARAAAPPSGVALARLCALAPPWPRLQRSAGQGAAGASRNAAWPRATCRAVLRRRSRAPPRWCAAGVWLPAAHGWSGPLPMHQLLRQPRTQSRLLDSRAPRPFGPRLWRAGRASYIYEQHFFENNGAVILEIN